MSRKTIISIVYKALPGPARGRSGELAAVQHESNDDTQTNIQIYSYISFIIDILCKLCSYLGRGTAATVVGSLTWQLRNPLLLHYLYHSFNACLVVEANASACLLAFTGLEAATLASSHSTKILLLFIIFQ